MDDKIIVCEKCGKPSWAPYVMVIVRKKYGRVYRYRVYRHPDRRRRKTPRKHVVRIP